MKAFVLALASLHLSGPSLSRRKVSKHKSPTLHPSGVNEGRETLWLASTAQTVTPASKKDIKYTTGPSTNRKPTGLFMAQQQVLPLWTSETPQLREAPQPRAGPRSVGDADNFRQRRLSPAFAADDEEAALVLSKASLPFTPGRSSHFRHASGLLNVPERSAAQKSASRDYARQ